MLQQLRPFALVAVLLLAASPVLAEPPAQRSVDSVSTVIADVWNDILAVFSNDTEAPTEPIDGDDGDDDEVGPVADPNG